jgi:aminoglycoside/choline kinase family phosphotransferase
MTVLDSRQQALQQWAVKQLGHDIKLTPLAGDASFRRYFRLRWENQSLVAMDAPTDKEDCHPFVALSKIFSALGLQVPKVIHADLTRGFLILTDLGDRLYFNELNENNADQLYGAAIDSLLALQHYRSRDHFNFPAFDNLMVEELARFREWYLLRHLQLELTTHEETMLTNSFNYLVTSAIQQPQVCVHRDYHSRNLMVLPKKQVGILDFQDAVRGPVAYDLVSLLRDCYISWPQAKVQQWMQTYFIKAQSQGMLLTNTLSEFQRWLDWMGMQRHLKAIYIFARKFHRDNNPNYLNDIPRTLNYVLQVGEQYAEFKPLVKFLKEKISVAGVTIN